jgi:hypothetical protein
MVQSPVRTKEWVITPNGEPMRIWATQAMGLREAARTQVKAYMASIVTEMVEAWDTYDQIKRGTGSTRRKILGKLGGASDPGDQSQAKDNIIEVRNSKVYPLADEGKYVEALDEILRQKTEVERRARAVGDYDADLDTGYSRLSTAAQVVQVALVSLVPIAGEAAMGATIVEGVVVEGASGLAVAGTGAAAGAGGAMLGETGRQLAFEDQMDYGKIGKTGWTGGTIGLGAAGGAMTKGISNFVAPAATGTEAVGANMFASSVVGAGQDILGGGNGVTGAAAGGLGSMAGHLADSVAPLANAPVANVAAQGAAGAGVAYLTDQDVIGGAVGNMTGAIGNKMRMPKPGAETTAPGQPAERRIGPVDESRISGQSDVGIGPVASIADAGAGGASGPATPAPGPAARSTANVTPTKNLAPHPAPPAEGPISGSKPANGSGGHRMDPPTTDANARGGSKPRPGSAPAAKDSAGDAAPQSLEPKRRGTATASLDYPAGATQLNTRAGSGAGAGHERSSRPAPSAEDLKPRQRSDALRRKAAAELAQAQQRMVTVRDDPPTSPMRQLAEAELQNAQRRFALAHGDAAPTADELGRLRADEALADAESDYADARGASNSVKRVAAEERFAKAKEAFDRAREALAQAHTNARSAQEHAEPNSPLTMAATAEFDKASAAFKAAKAELAQAKTERAKARAGLAPSDWRRRRAELGLNAARRQHAEEYGVKAPDEIPVGPMRKGEKEELQGPAAPERFAPERWDQEMVIQLADPRSKAAAEELVIRMLIQDPTREIGLFRNSITGEYIVVRGKTSTVTVESKPGSGPDHGGSGPASGGKMQRWKELLGSTPDIGDWELELHSHPNAAGKPVNPLTQYPSGGAGDYGVLYTDSLRSGLMPKKSRIWFFDGNEIKMTEFGIDPHDPEPYWFKLPGQPVHRFVSIEAYQAHVGYAMEPFGIVPNFEPIRRPMLVGQGYDHNPPLDQP